MRACGKKKKSFRLPFCSFPPPSPPPLNAYICFHQPTTIRSRSHTHAKKGSSILFDSSVSSSPPSSSSFLLPGGSVELLLFFFHTYLSPVFHLFSTLFVFCLPFHLYPLCLLLHHTLLTFQCPRLSLSFFCVKYRTRLSVYPIHTLGRLSTQRTMPPRERRRAEIIRVGSRSGFGAAGAGWQVYVLIKSPTPLCFDEVGTAAEGTGVLSSRTPPTAKPLPSAQRWRRRRRLHPTTSQSSQL